MIQATLKGRDIEITATEDSRFTASEIPGVTRNKKMPLLTWTLPFGLESIKKLRAVGAMASPQLIRAAKQAEAAALYVAQMKCAGQVEPMRPVPIRPGVTLYNHQIKAYNIALALFGYDTKGGEGG